MDSVLQNKSWKIFKVARVRRYGLTFLGLTTSFYKSATCQQHWGWTVADTVFTMETKLGG